MLDPSLPVGDGPGGARGDTVDGWDLPVELKETRTHVDGIKGKRAAEAEQLS
jgi:hypothetical protein